MKYIIVVFFFFLLGCTKLEIKNSDNVRLKLSKKELTKLFKGQELYSIKGMKTEFESINVRVKSIPSKEDYLLLLDFNNSYYNGSKEILLHSNLTYFKIYNNLKWYIKKHKLIWPKTKLVTVNFNKKVKKDFTVLSIPDKESIEYSGKRFLQKLSYLPKKQKFDLEKSEITSIVNYNTCFDYDYKSLTLLSVYLQQTGIKFSSASALKIIPNPITNTLEVLPDFSQISTSKEGLSFKGYIKLLNTIKPVNLIKLEKEIQAFTGNSNNKKEIVYKEIIFKGLLNVYEDINLENIHLKVEPNTKINLYNNSKIIIDKGLVSFNGKENNPIIIKGFGENSLFISNVNSCNFEYTFFNSLSNWSDNCKTVPSAITIYNSNSKFNFCEFRNNKRGDDMINLFQSKYIINNCLFDNILSDALDSDFSEGNITNTTYIGIGNDAVDCSGSNLQIYNSIFSNISDKAISAGENSTITVTNSTIQESAIGYVSKDGSYLKIEGENKLIKNDLDFAVFVKKPFYKKPQISFNKEMNKYTYLIQENSIVNSKDQKLYFLKEVESKLYGNEYGKSSK